MALTIGQGSEARPCLVGWIVMSNRNRENLTDPLLAGRFHPGRAGGHQGRWIDSLAPGGSPARFRGPVAVRVQP